MTRKSFESGSAWQFARESVSTLTEMRPDRQEVPDRHTARLRRGAAVVVGGLVLLWTFVPTPSAWIEEYYARGFFRWVGSCLVPLNDAIPVSLSGILLAGLVVVLVIVSVRRLRQGRPWRDTLRWGFGHGLLLVLTTYVLFLLTWGAGYSRPPLEEKLALSLDSPGADEMERFASGLLERVHTYALTATNEQRDTQQAVRAIRDSMVDLVSAWDGGLPTIPPRVKTLPAGSLLCTGSAGITSPFFLEAHVDAGLPEAAFVSVAAHELAHVAGYCRESDADLLGSLAGLRATDEFARYAIALFLFRDVTAHLDSTRRDEMRARLPRVGRNDLQLAREAYGRYRISWLSELQSVFYDSYLKSQGVDEGVKNYGRGVLLVFRVWQSGGL